MLRQRYPQMLLRVLALCLLPLLASAHDTEIYYAQAKADNEENAPIANVLFMFDTSGSMRWCENTERGGSGYNAPWCSNVEKRRINMLQNAMREVVQNASPNTRIGLGRFNFDTVDTDTGNFRSQLGGRIDIPVVEVNSATLPIMMTYLDTLNDAGNNADGGQHGQPVGDTPTARAYSEAARYMLGAKPKYGIAANQAENAAICSRMTTDEESCQTVIDEWGEWQDISGTCDTSLEGCRSAGTQQTEVGFCNANDANCEVTYSPWQSIGTTPCDISNTDLCTRQCVNFLGLSVNENRCINQTGGLLGPRFVYEQRTIERYELITPRFQQREVLSTQEVCEDVCAEETPIVTNGFYHSPINLQNECESNHIVLFTDGAPSGDDRPASEAFEGQSGSHTINCSNNSSYQCQIKISSYLSNNNNLKGHSVRTYNIGLYMGDNEGNMRSVSTDGADGTYNADDAESLIEAFELIMNLIDEESRSISAPGVAVNRMNRFEHLDQLYYAVFQPGLSSYWEGNLKRYRLDGGQIVDAFGNRATSNTTGYFRESARSFWSKSADGFDAVRGGARENLQDRTLFYGSSGNLSKVDWANVGDGPLTNTFFGLPADAPDEDLTRLAQRLRTLWGDPLHSVPVLVNYGGGAAAATQNNVVFVSTNAGMLHAINSLNGEEIFAWMPDEFINQSNKFTVNRLGLNNDNTRQLYGLDGSWTAWRGPGQNPDHVYLYGGMRRGGKTYYALNVTNTANPSVMWRIQAGQQGFESMGQTWSTPVLTQIPTASGPRPVIIFGGGYSPDDHDQHRNRTNGDAMGNAIYIVDARTGQLVWSASSRASAVKRVPDMKYAIPSSVAVVDVSANGVADYLYVGDLGGQVFRVDIDEEGDNDHQVHTIASLGGTGANHRRFYEPPAVAYMENQQGPLFYVAIGSGYRAHPLDEDTNEAFFVLKDDNVMPASAPGSTLTLSDLSNVTSANSTVDDNRQGWYYFFERSGEKALSSPLIFNNRLFFATYAPVGDTEQDNPCAVRVGRSFLHTVNLTTARGENEEGEEAPRSEELLQQTPPPTPVLIMGPDGEVTVVVGTETLGDLTPLDMSLQRQRWYQLEPDQANFIFSNP